MPYIELNSPAEIRRVLPGSVVDLGVIAGGTLGIVIYDRERQEAYAGHFIDPTIDSFEELVQRALATFQRRDSVEVYVTGASVELLDGPYADALIGGREFLENIASGIIAERRFVENVLKKADFHPDQTYIRWTPPRSETCFQLDVDTGENELRITSDGFRKHVYQGDIRKAPTNFIDRRSLN